MMDVLSQTHEVREENPIGEMAEIFENKADSEGRFTPESIWTDWRGWDFG
jgi:hypothetical protein